MVTFAGARFRIVELDGALVANAATCPHWSGPLDEAPVLDGCVRCPWHGYRAQAVIIHADGSQQTSTLNFSTGKHDFERLTAAVVASEDYARSRCASSTARRPVSCASTA